MLGDDKDAIAVKYHAALETKHRVDGDLLLDTVNQLLEIQNFYSDFEYYIQYNILDSVTSVTGRIETLAINANDMVIRDVSSMFSALDEYEEAYRVHLRPMVLAASSALEDLSSAASMLVPVLLVWRNQSSAARYDTDWAQKLLEDTNTSAVHVREVIGLFTQVDTSLDDKYSDWSDKLPQHLQSEDQEQKRCKEVQTFILHSTNETTFPLYALDLNLSAPIPDGYEDAVKDLEKSLNELSIKALDLIDCYGQYESLINTIKAWVFTISSIIQTDMVSYDSSSISDKLDVASKFLYDLLYNYTNGMTKLELAYAVGSSEMTSILDDIDTIVQDDIDESIISIMQIDLGDQTRQTTDNYIAGLTHAATFEKHFDGRETTNARLIDLWTKPMPSLDSKEVR